MLLASPLRPGAIVLGKLLASLAHLAILIFSSLPIVMLCLPLGGVSLYEVLAAYLALILSVITFGMISVACSSYFQRTAASLVVSYLMILPLAIGGRADLDAASRRRGELRLYSGGDRAAGRLRGDLLVAVFIDDAQRLLHPPDVGSEGKEVVDLEAGSAPGRGPGDSARSISRPAVRPGQADHAAARRRESGLRQGNAQRDFRQGTLMLRLVIQVSMLLAIPLMAVCLYVKPDLAPWYICYVVLFNMLVGPVFSAGSVTSERERQTLDLLLTTIISPWQILWGKLVSGLRVSSVLTSFLLWPVLLACVMVPYYWSNLISVAAFLGVILMCCLTTATVALFCSVVFRKTAHSLMTTYMVIIVLFCLPLAMRFFAEQFFEKAKATPIVRAVSLTSPFAAAFAVPMHFGNPNEVPDHAANWLLYFSYLGFSGALLGLMLIAMIWLFNTRWRVAE